MAVIFLFYITLVTVSSLFAIACSMLTLNLLLSGFFFFFFFFSTECLDTWISSRVDSIAACAGHFSTCEIFHTEETAASKSIL